MFTQRRWDASRRSAHRYPRTTLDQADSRRPRGETVARNNYSANLHTDFEVTFTRTTTEPVFQRTNEPFTRVLSMRMLPERVNQDCGRQGEETRVDSSLNCTVRDRERCYWGIIRGYSITARLYEEISRLRDFGECQWRGCLVNGQIAFRGSLFHYRK